MMVPDLDNIGEKLFFVVILGGLEGFVYTLDDMFCVPLNGILFYALFCIL